MNGPSKEKILAAYEKDYENAKSYWDDIHKEYRADKEFVFLDQQWDKDVEAARKSSQVGESPRITLTINRTHQHIMQVANDIKRAEMGIKVRPKDSGTDKIIAEVRQGIIRSIERNSGGIQCYSQAVLDQVAAGLGAWRLVTDYADSMSFDQEIQFKQIMDASTVLMDPDCTKDDYSDSRMAIVEERYGKARFKKEFKIDPENIKSGDSVAWGSSETPIVSEYFFKEETKETLVKGKDGKTYYLSDVRKEMEDSGLAEDDLLEKDDEGELIQRETTRCKVWWSKLAGKKVLDVQEWPGEYIPVFLITGRKTVVNGKVRIEGLTRRAKASQQAYNYARSASVERMAYGTKAPWVVPEGSIPPNEAPKWNTANTRPWSRLVYRQYDEKGRALNQPHRPEPIGSDPAILNETAQSVDDLKSSLGMYNASIGQQGNETSGRAILARQQEGDTATYDFGYYASIGVRHTGRVLGDLISKVYDTPRQVRMVGEDEKEKVVWVNKQAEDDQGNPYQYNLNVGKFDIEIEMGPSQATKRMETIEGMQALFQSAPGAAEIMGDFYAMEQDWRHSDKMAERYKKFLGMKYPGMIEDEQQKQDPQVAQMMQQMQQLQQQMQQLMGENQQLKTDKTIEFEKVGIEKFSAETERMKTLAEIDNQRKKTTLDAFQAVKQGPTDAPESGNQRTGAVTAG